MKKRFIRQRCLIGLGVVLVAATCFQLVAKPGPVKARVSTQTSGAGLSVWRTNFGIAPGQAARITVAHLAQPRSMQPLYYQARVFDQNGALLFQSDRRKVPPGEFRYENIFHRDLNVDGEPETGRVQMSMAIFVFLPHGRKSSDVLITGEVLDEQTGETHWVVPLLPFIEQDSLYDDFQIWQRNFGITPG